MSEDGKRDEVRRLRAGGRSIRQIADDLGLSVAGVQRRLADTPADTPPDSGLDSTDTPASTDTPVTDTPAVSVDRIDTPVHMVSGVWSALLGPDVSAQVSAFIGRRPGGRRRGSDEHLESMQAYCFEACGGVPSSAEVARVAVTARLWMDVRGERPFCRACWATEEAKPADERVPASERPRLWNVRSSSVLEEPDGMACRRMTCERRNVVVCRVPFVPAKGSEPCYHPLGARTQIGKSELATCKCGAVCRWFKGSPENRPKEPATSF